MMLEVGKTYSSRDEKEIVRIVDMTPIPSNTIIGYMFGEVHPFIGDNGDLYTLTGKWDEYKESPYDLVKEI